MCVKVAAIWLANCKSADSYEDAAAQDAGANLTWKPGRDYDIQTTLERT